MARGFLIGLAVGVVATLLVLDAWGRHYANEIFQYPQPRLVRLFAKRYFNGITIMAPGAPTRLPEPWLPGLNSKLHRDWRLKSLSGTTVALDGFKGKAVFLDFWETSCGPCVSEMASIKRLADSLSNENVAFLLAARDSESRVREFVQKHPIGLPIYLASQGTPDMPDSPMPATYILNAQGVVVFQQIGAVDWDTDHVRSFLRSLENP